MIIKIKKYFSIGLITNQLWIELVIYYEGWF